MADGGQRNQLADDRGERGFTIFLIAIVFVISALAVSQYGSSRLVEWLSGNWIWLALIGGVIFVLYWRAYQGVTTGENVKSVSVSRGGSGGSGGGGGGGTSSWMFLLYGIVIIVVLFLLLKVVGLVVSLPGMIGDAVDTVWDKITFWD